MIKETCRESWTPFTSINSKRFFTFAGSAPSIVNTCSFTISSVTAPETSPNHPGQQWGFVSESASKWMLVTSCTVAFHIHVTTTLKERRVPCPYDRRLPAPLQQSHCRSTFELCQAGGGWGVTVNVIAIANTVAVIEWTSDVSRLHLVATDEVPALTEQLSWTEQGMCECRLASWRTAHWGPRFCVLCSVDLSTASCDPKSPFIGDWAD